MKLLFSDMTREELRQCAPRALAVVPIGATEQHGPHLPSGTDWMLVNEIALAAAEQASRSIPVVVTPALPFGSSHHHLPFGATISFSTETYYRVLREILLSLAGDGFRRIFLLNGHGGNIDLAQLASRDTALEKDVRIAAASYWTIAWDALVAVGANEEGRLPGHAGRFETSMILARWPALVASAPPHRDGSFRTDPSGRAPAYKTEQHGFWQSIDGFSDSPDRASSEEGRRYLEAVSNAVARAFVEFHA